jgi:hypothetical protein
MNLIQLRPYQEQVFRSLLGILFFIWRRQSGKSHGLANIALDWMMETPGITVIFMSAALRLGMENIRKEAEVWRAVTQLMRANMNGQGQFKITTAADDDAGALLDVDAVADLMEHQKLECKLWHDNATYSRSLVIAPNPDTAVGFTGHLILDEVGRMPNFREVWEAAQPFVESNPNFLIRGATTPPPNDDHFSYELLADRGQMFTPNPLGNFYRSLSGLPVHRLDAHDAALANVPLYDLESRQPITPEESRARSIDKVAWDRNYGCKFIRGGAAALSRQDLQTAAAAGRDFSTGLHVTDILTA